MKVGFTGTREGMTEPQRKRVREFLRTHIIEEFHHGKCKGSDAQAHQIAWDELFRVKRIILHPPEDDKYEAIVRTTDSDVIELSRKPYLQRNKDIVDAVDILIATPKTKEEEKRSGTWATVRYAKKRGIQVVIISPDGIKTKSENWCLRDKITKPYTIGTYVKGFWAKVEDINTLREKLIEDFDNDPKATKIINKRFRGEFVHETNLVDV